MFTQIEHFMHQLPINSNSLTEFNNLIDSNEFKNELELVNSLGFLPFLLLKPEFEILSTEVQMKIVLEIKDRL